MRCHFALLGASLAGLALAAPLRGGTAGSRSAHPLDGPDVDLRLQVARDKVTLQAIFNLAFLDELVSVAREDEYAIGEPEKPVLRARMFAWLRLNTTLQVDGVAVTPTLAGFDVDPGDPRWLPMFPNLGAKALIRARFQLEFKALQAPRTVNLVWRAYPPNLVLSQGADKVYNEVQVLWTAGGTEQVVTLRHDEPEFTWHAPADGTAVRLLPVPQPAQPPKLRLPLLGGGAAAGALLVALSCAWRRRWRRMALALVAGSGLTLACWPVAGVMVASPFAARVPLPTSTEALAIFAPLHANLYRAFDYTEASEVYDALARSVEGSLLDTIYQDVYRSLVMAEEGGAVSRVQAVRAVQTDVERVGVLDDGRTPSFTVDARWQVDGAVFHWGHQHWRTNEHRARYTVVSTGDGWRIAGAEPLAQARLESGPGFRKPGDAPDSTAPAVTSPTKR